MSLRDFFRRYVLVRFCGGCGEILSYEHGEAALCPACRLTYDRAKTESCPVCFSAMSECLCVPKLLRDVEAVGLCKLFRYSPSKSNQPQNRMLYTIKKQPVRRYMAFFASELTPIILRTLKDAGVEHAPSETVLVSVPRGRRAKSRYGFDQSEEICKFLSEKTGIPYASGVLRRKRGGKEQKKLSRSEREKNLKGLLYLKKGVSLHGKTVILFDDIVTTGASLSACIPLLRDAGAEQMLFAALAVTGEEKHTRT